MPISVGNGQQIAPRLPRSRGRSNAKAQKQSIPAALDPANPPLRQIEQRAKRHERKAERIRQSLPNPPQSAARAPSAVPSQGVSRQELTQPVGKPFAKQVRESKQREDRARAALPNHPRLAIFPVLPSYTEQQKDVILRTQGPRLQRVMAESGKSADELVAGLSPRDAEQVGLFARLVRERTVRSQARRRREDRRVARRLRAQGVSPDEIASVLAPARAVPGRPGSTGEKLTGGLATILPATIKGPQLANSLAQIGNVGDAAGQLAAPTLRDARSLVLDTPAALYATGAAGVAAVQGDLGPAKALVDAQMQGAIGHLVRGDVKGALAYAGEHPLLAQLEFSGAAGAAGRGAGAVSRSGVLGASVKRAARLDRAPLVDVNGRVIEARRYSPDLIRKGVQVAGERSQRKRGIDPDVVRDGRFVHTQERKSNAAVDEFVGMAEAQRRTGRQEAVKRLEGFVPERSRGRRVLRRPARGEDVVSAVVEGRIDLRSFEPDLKAERARLERAYVGNRAGMSSAARRANREQVRALDKVLKDPKALGNVRGLREAAGRYRDAADRLEGELVRQGLLDPDQAVQAKLRPYAVSKMGARVVDGRVVDADGAPLAPQAVIEHMREHGVEMPAFVSHRMDTSRC